MRHALAISVLLSLAACVSPAGPATKPNEREWGILTADYQWLETVRTAQKQPVPAMTRKERIELLLENHKKLQPTYFAFIDKVHEYYERTADPRAAALLAREKIILGDEYMSVLSRYDRAIELYRQAVGFGSVEAAGRIALAEGKRYVSMSAFANVKAGMKEDAVERLIGLPREDWIKQVVQKNRIYAVWIYPKADGGASAVYFDNSVVYHTNWNAAAPSTGGAASR